MAPVNVEEQFRTRFTFRSVTATEEGIELDLDEPIRSRGGTSILALVLTREEAAWLREELDALLATGGGRHD